MVKFAFLLASAVVAVAIMPEDAVADSPMGVRDHIVISDAEKVSIRSQTQSILASYYASATTNSSAAASNNNNNSTRSLLAQGPPSNLDGCYRNFEYTFGNGQFDWNKLELTGSYWNDDNLNLKSGRGGGSRIGTKEAFYNPNNVMGLGVTMRPSGNQGKMSYFALREKWAANCADPNGCRSDEVDWEFPGSHLGRHSIDNVVFNAGGRTYYSTTQTQNNPQDELADYWIFLQNNRYLAFTYYRNGEQHIKEFWADQSYVPTKPMAAYVGIWDCNNDYCGYTWEDDTWMSVKRLAGWTCGGK